MKNKYVVTRRPDVSFTAYDVSCRECDFQSNGWDFRINAVSMGRLHAFGEHGVNFPSGTQLGFGNTRRVVGAL